MKRSKSVAWCVGWLAVFVATMAHGGELTPLESEMSRAEFRAAGLDKLTEEELRELNAWLRLQGRGDVSSSDAKTASAQDAAHASPFAPVPDVMETPAAPETAKTTGTTDTQEPSETLETVDKAETPTTTTTDEEFGVEELPVREEKPDEPQSIASYIVGEFNGWRGKTVFHLANGQVWQQRYSGSYYHRMDRPTVRVEKSFAGYKLVIEETGASIGVRRIR
jgi:hypothetical protein